MLIALLGGIEVFGLAGLFVGIFFLSFCYHSLLWIHIGLAGALYNAVRRHDPTFTVSFGRKEIAALTVVYLVVLSAISFYVKHKA